VRDICDYRDPPDFRFQGLGDVLRRLCLDFDKRTGIDCRIDIAENISLDSINEGKQLPIFRIVQEALTNVEKHAEASEAIVILRKGNGGTISTCVSDDGKGFISSGGEVELISPERTINILREMSIFAYVA
jgi:signal transduction histidine kinase